MFRTPSRSRAILFCFAILSVLLIATGTACGGITPANAESSTVRVGAWNLEWFGALGRSDDDIRRIAEIIRELQIDILALEEITCPCTLDQLAGQLGWQSFISPQRVPQKLALIWNPQTIGSVAFDEEAYDALRRVGDTGLDRESRQPIVFDVKAGAFDFTFVVVHLKSIPEAERSVEIRNVQYDAINGWLAQRLATPGAERDIIIAGDFNAYTRGISSARFLEAGHMVFATAESPRGEYSNIWYNRDGQRLQSFIDHIAITATLKSEEYRQILPIRDWDEELGRQYYEEHVSDHLPVVAIFGSERDID
jgi:endonuclease/exonuclease/phosphatase family metal-dependent hydrolase